MQINLNYQKGFKVQLFQILLFQLILSFTSDLIITNLLIYTEGNIYWTLGLNFHLTVSTVKSYHPINTLIGKTD